MAGGKLSGLKKGKSASKDINVTPLIDVVLVLLIIFMVITPILVDEMAVNLPEKTETVDLEDVPKDQLVAAACPDGTFALNKQVMGLPDLREQVKRRLRGRAQKVVFVDGHPDVAYDSIVQLMDAVRGAGADKVGVATLKEGDEFTACSATPAAPVEGAEGAAPPTP